MAAKYKTIATKEFISVVTHRPVLFMGAGVSVAAPSLLPLAGQLVKAFYDALTHDAELSGLVDDLPVNELPKDLLRHLGSPELIYNAASEFAADIVPELFRAALESNHPNVNHYSAARLLEYDRITRIITTNFDTLIEQCFDAARPKIHVYVEDEGPGEEGCLWKLHGDLGSRVAIAANDVSLIGFSSVPSKLADVIAGSKVIVAGYSGNDFHIVRAFLDGRPEKIWWIILRDDPPVVLDMLAKSGLDVVAVEGNLASFNQVNPLVALLQCGQTTEIPATITDHNYVVSKDDLQDRLSNVLAPLERTKKALILNSLLRRVGIPTNKKYRIHISKFLHESMLKEKFFPDYFSSPPFDVLELYEQKLTPRLVVRPAILRRHGLSVEPDDPFGNVNFNENVISKKFSRFDETDILLEFGLEKAYQGGSKLERARMILKAAYQSTESLQHRALRMRSAEALAWVNLKLGNLEEAEVSHAVFFDEIAKVITDLNVIRESFSQASVDHLLIGLDPLDEPLHLYKTLAVDRRYRRCLNLLRLAARLRYLGKAELALKVLDQWPADISKSSIYTDALEGAHEVERSRCLFFMGEVAGGIKLMEVAEKRFAKLENWDYEFLRWYSRILTQYYVKAGQIGKAVGIEIKQHVIPTTHYERSEDK